MIRTPAKRKFRNPDVSNLISTKIGSDRGTYYVSAFAGSSKILTVDNIRTRTAAEKISNVTKKTLEKELKSANSAKRSNPDYELQDSLKRAIGKSIALPDDKMEAFELGRLVGTQECLNRYSGIFNFWERRKALKAVDKAIKGALGNLARTVLVRGEGIEGPVPFVKKSSKSN